MKHTPTKILVPTDFSPASDRAFSIAKELADRFDAEIHLLRVRVIIDDPFVKPAILDKVERILAVSDSETKQALEQAGKDGGTRIHAHLKKGTAPAAAIIDAVSEYKCDLVVMGTHGRRGLKGLLLGSVAREVVHRSPVPVVTTRPAPKGAPVPRKILVAYDYSENALPGVRTAAEWARRLSADVTLLHVVEQTVYPEFYFDHAPREEHLDQSTEWSREHLDLIAQKHLSGVPHETAVIHGPAAKGIADFASTNGFDLVVLATRGRSGVAHSFFGSVAERVTQLSEVPVLTVRPQAPIPAEEPDRGSRSQTRKRASMGSKKVSTNRDRPEAFSVERLPNTTVLRFHERESLAGADLGLLGGLWEFFENERRAPSPVTLVLAPPDLFGPKSLEKLLDDHAATGVMGAGEVGERIVREGNVIQRFIENVRAMDSFVVGVVVGEIAFPLAAPFLACDYRIASSDTVFVNTTQTIPRAPLGCLPWLLARSVGGAKASQLMLDVPRLSASDAHDLGLVNHIATADRLEVEALEIAGRLGSLPRATLVSLKRAIIASGEDFETYREHELALTQRMASSHWKEM